MSHISYMLNGDESFFCHIGLNLHCYRTIQLSVFLPVQRAVMSHGRFSGLDGARWSGLGRYF